MGGDKQLEGIYPRSASILIGFQWNKERYRERLELRPTTANLRAAARIRGEIVSLIELGKFTWKEFAEYFPNSPRLKANAVPVGERFDEVVEKWLEVVEQELAATTFKEYRNTIQRHFVEPWRDKEFARISYEELALLLAKKKIKSAKTFNNVMTPLRKLFAYGIKTRRITEDIAAEIPSQKNQRPGPDPLEVEEIELVLAHLRDKYDEQWWNYFEFAFFSGLRPSELIALTWPKVDFRRSKARIDAARVRAVDKDAKTHKARDIDIQTRAMQALLRQKKRTFLAGAHVFHNPNTNERFPDTGKPVRLVWRPTLKALGIRDRDAKQTRHSFATMCLHAGINPAYVARQMGHADTRMFFEVYSKWIDGQANDRERLKLDALFKQNKGVEAL